MKIKTVFATGSKMASLQARVKILSMLTKMVSAIIVRMGKEETAKGKVTSNVMGKATDKAMGMEIAEEKAGETDSVPFKKKQSLNH